MPSSAEIAYNESMRSLDSQSHDLANVRAQPEPNFVMRELAVHAADNHKVNKATLRRLWRLQALALLLFGVEVVALMSNIALEAQ